MSEVDVAVIGAGPAGTHAALAAASTGLSVALFDDNPSAGGQIFRAPVAGVVVGNSVERQAGDALRRALAASKVTTFFAHSVWAVTGAYRIDAVGPQGPAHCTARALIVASGATERIVPFEGWTAPGVIGLADAAILLNSQGLPPGRSTLVAGCGPWLAAVAAKTIDNGGNVAAIADLAGTADWVRTLPAMAARPDLLLQAMRGWSTIRRAGTPRYGRHSVVRIEPANDHLRATLAPCDTSGRPLDTHRTTVLADCIVVGHGLTPATEITRLLRAEHRYSRGAGGWIPVADQDGRTSRTLLYVAGDAAGIVGAAAAATGGILAGVACAFDLGAADPSRQKRRVQSLRGKQRRAARFRHAMATLMAPSAAYVDSIPPQTIVCRCEEVTRAEIDAACDAGAHDMNQLKAWTRCGMGLCQSRTCGDIAGDLLMRRLGAPSREAVGCFSARTPLRPVTIEALTGDFSYDDIAIPQAAPL
jgi:NADPH-dependent 2,4-dienoyl-CoA reductase/sulfur reductase-like enzyme/bacterioferritin-associated ferredoxin